MKDVLEQYFDRLFPLNRSLTGEGNRETLRIISELIDLKITEVPSGTKCFDWNVPPEWNVRSAYIRDSRGRDVVNFENHNLHLLGYSAPFQGRIPLAELKQHIYTLPEHPDWIPYKTSYYERKWGFCMSHNQLAALEDETYEVVVDTTLDELGSMTVGEAVIPGTSDEEVLFSTYICHPSMANNELSGPLVTAFLYRALKERSRPLLTCRFLLMPETIGAIWYLSEHGGRLKKKLRAGYVLSCLGHEGEFTFKRSRAGNSLADRAAESDLGKEALTILDFVPWGSDERQYCSPGFDLPFGVISRTAYERYPEYHTSADDKSRVSFTSMEESVGVLLRLVNTLESCGTSAADTRPGQDPSELGERYQSLNPYCEPRLGNRGVYPTIRSGKSEHLQAILWVLNQSDGQHDLESIQVRSGLPLEAIQQAANDLLAKGLLEKITT